MSESDLRQVEQVKLNYAEFVKLLPDIFGGYAGKFALMHDGKIIEYFDTSADAFTAGVLVYKDGVFSIQEVTYGPVFILSTK